MAGVLLPGSGDLTVQIGEGPAQLVWRRDDRDSASSTASSDIDVQAASAPTASISAIS